MRKGGGTRARAGRYQKRPRRCPLPLLLPFRRAPRVNSSSRIKAAKKAVSDRLNAIRLSDNLRRAPDCVRCCRSDRLQLDAEKLKKAEERPRPLLPLLKKEKKIKNGSENP